jgi:hypothetical protein
MDRAIARFVSRRPNHDVEDLLGNVLVGWRFGTCADSGPDRLILRH